MKTLKKTLLTTLASDLMPLCLLLLVPALTRAETAVEAWVQRYSGSGNYDDVAAAVVVDGNNNVIVTGYSFGTNGSYDYVTIQYSSAGVPLWTNRYDSENGEDKARAVVVDGSNNVIVTGSSGTIQYSSAGVPLWTNNGYATAMAVDGSNNVIVTGSSGTIQYSSAGVPLWTNNGYAAIAVDGSNNVIVTGNSTTIQYSSAGVPLWTNRYTVGGGL